MISEGIVPAEIRQQYLKENKRLTPLNGKRPILKDWPHQEISEENLANHLDNLGWVLGESDLVVDVDPKNGGIESYERLLRDLSITLTPTVSTPSDGHHVYLTIPTEYVGKSFRKTLSEYKGIDFLTRGSQCVIPGSRTENGRYHWNDWLLGEFEQLPAPIPLLDCIVAENGNSARTNGLGDFEGLVGNRSHTRDQVLGFLSKLNPSMNNDSWVRVGMALHDWDPTEGLEIWENWSKPGDNYKTGETDIRWKSFSTEGGVSLGSVVHMAQVAEYDNEQEIITAYIDRIAIADEKTLKMKICTELQKEQLSALDFERAAMAIQQRYQELIGVRMPIAAVRKLIAPKVKLTRIDKNAPDFCKDWVYVNSHSAFVDIDKLTVHKPESFNLECGKYIPAGEGGSKPSASKYVSDNGFMRKVDLIAYLPTVEGVFCELDGLTILNSFNGKSLPTGAKKFSKDGLEAIETVKNHIRFICTTDRNTDILTQWLAHQIQYPGRKILWSPVIQSIQGAGKSFFGELLRACLGDRNIGVVSPSQVVSQFNSWATDVAVNILEELRMQGHNRFDALNALKPLITDSKIQINEKGIRQYMAFNTTNYICFTNSRDSLPLELDDRRWWVIFVPIESLSDMDKYVGMDAEQYFKKLFNAVRKHGPELRKWLLEYKISKDFMRIKYAPMTPSKRSMIATEEASTDGLLEIKSMIESGGKFYNKHVISSTDLFQDLMFEFPETNVYHTTQRNAILKRLNYVSMGIVKIEGKSRRIWSRQPIDKKTAKRLLIEHDPELNDL